jgi:predicted ATP-dependent serine protease
MTSIQLPFTHPTTVLIAGPTGSGKTQFLLQVTQNQAIQPPPKRIVCVYGEWQPAYDKIK